MSIILVAIVAVAVLVVGFVMPGVRENRRYSALPKQQTLPSPQPMPKAPIEGYHTLAEIWDYTFSGSGTPEPAADTQYAVKEPKPTHPRPPAGGTGVSSPVKQSFGHYGLDFSTLTAAKITTDTLHASTFEDVHLFRTLAQDAYVRASPYRKSEYVRIAEAGMRERVVGYVHGEPFGGAGTSTDVWFVLEDESVVWSGCFTNKSTVGLYPYDVDEPEIFEQKSFSGRVVSTVTTYPTVRKPYAA